MKLLTKDEALKLQPGNTVNVYWFKARQPFEAQHVDSVWKNRVIGSSPRLPACAEDGVLVTLQESVCSFNALKMELVP